MALATGTAILAAAVLGAGTAAITAEEGRKSASKAASKARALFDNESPAAIPGTGGGPLDSLRGRKKRRGRADTIVTGSLIPEDVGTKSLLG